jgi:hypothetical protein
MHKQGRRNQKLGRSRRSGTRARKQRTRDQRGGEGEGQWTNSRNLVVMSVTHHRQNHLECKIAYIYIPF